MRTLQSLLIDVNSFLDKDAAIPTGTDLSIRANFANQSIWDASAVAQFSEFHQIYHVDPAALASVPLPSNFKELMVGPRQLLSNGQWSEPFNEIRPLERFEKSSSDRYCYILGNPAAGYTAVFNGLTANATLSFDYQRFPSGLLTLTDVCELSDPQFVVVSTESYVLESRSDDRFPIKRAESNSKLQNLIGREMKTPGGGINTTPRIGIGKYSIG